QFRRIKMVNPTASCLLFFAQRRSRSMEPSSVDHWPDRRHTPARGKVVFLVHLAAFTRSTDGTGRLFGHRHPCGISPISLSPMTHMHRRSCSWSSTTGSALPNLAADSTTLKCTNHDKKTCRVLHLAPLRMNQNFAARRPERALKPLG